MANGLYVYGKQTINFTTLTAANVKVCLVRGYTPNYSTHQFLSDVTGGGGGTIVATSGVLTNPAWANATYNADDVTLPLVPAGAACQFLVLFIDTGVAATSTLICGLDTGFTGLPITPDGKDIVLVWAAGGIFTL